MFSSTESVIQQLRSGVDCYQLNSKEK